MPPMAISKATLDGRVTKQICAYQEKILWWIYCVNYHTAQPA